MVAVAWRGSYGQDARAVVAVLAGVAALVTFAVIDAALPRSVVVWSLVGLGLLSGLSAAWTIGSSGEALRDGLAILGLAAVVVVAAVTVDSVWLPAGVLLGAATAIAVVGVIAAIAQSDPLALQICNSWRPAGPFEYPPTLGLVCAGALPAAMAMVAARSRSRGGTAAGSRSRGTFAAEPRGGFALIRAAGALVAWLLALTIALTANRTAIAFGGAAFVATVWLAPHWRELAAVALAVIVAATASAFVTGTHLGDAGAGRLLLASAFALVPVLIAGRIAVRGGHGLWIAVIAAAAVAATAAGTLADKGSGCQGDASHGRVGIWRAAVATAADRPLQGNGSGAFLLASRDHQLEHRPRPTRFAHNQVLESWAELGIAGAALVAAWMISALALAWRTRARPGGWMIVPWVAFFPLANLLDWPWHLLGAGVLWAIAAGALLSEP